MQSTLITGKPAQHEQVSRSILFTQTNFERTVDRLKTETRRLDKNGKPTYKVGDIVYLKEPTQIIKCDQSPESRQWSALARYFWLFETSFWVDVTDADVDLLNKRKSGLDSKQNQLFMLKSLARYSIKITGVENQNLFDIDDDSAIAEGILCHPEEELYLNYLNDSYEFFCPIASYMSQWDKLHGSENTATNPKVWVYKYQLR